MNKLLTYAALAVLAAPATALITAVPATSAAASPAASSAASSAPECGNADLAASYVSTGAGMSHEFGRIRLRNVTAHACWVQGYGGLSYVGHGDGTQIGAPADRDPSRTPRVLLQPGQRAVSAISVTSTGPYDPVLCRPTHADGFRVYVPDATRSQFVRHPMTVCGNPVVHTLRHRAYHRL